MKSSFLKYLTTFAFLFLFLFFFKSEFKLSVFADIYCGTGQTCPNGSKRSYEFVESCSINPNGVCVDNMQDPQPKGTCGASSTGSGYNCGFNHDSYRCNRTTCAHERIATQFYDCCPGTGNGSACKICEGTNCNNSGISGCDSTLDECSTDYDCGASTPTPTPQCQGPKKFYERCGYSGLQWCAKGTSCNSGWVSGPSNQVTCSASQVLMNEGTYCLRWDGKRRWSGLPDGSGNGSVGCYTSSTCP